jgi:hypothetical protein
MDPITIIAILWTAAYALALIYLIILYFSRIVDFLRGREELKESDMDNIAFSLQEKVGSGDYQTVYGIFNKRTNQVLDAERITSEDIDAELKNIHAIKELAIYVNSNV